MVESFVEAPTSSTHVLRSRRNTIVGRCPLHHRSEFCGVDWPVDVACWGLLLLLELLLELLLLLHPLLRLPLLHASNIL